MSSLQHIAKLFPRVGTIQTTSESNIKDVLQIKTVSINTILGNVNM